MVKLVNEHMQLCEGKGWFTQFRHILYELEDFFMEEGNKDSLTLEKLALYFLLINDHAHFENIEQTRTYKDFGKRPFWASKKALLLAMEPGTPLLKIRQAK